MSDPREAYLLESAYIASTWGGIVAELRGLARSRYLSRLDAGLSVPAFPTGEDLPAPEDTPPVTGREVAAVLHGLWPHRADSARFRGLWYVYARSAYGAEDPDSPWDTTGKLGERFLPAYATIMWWAFLDDVAAELDGAGVEAALNVSPSSYQSRAFIDAARAADAAQQGATAIPIPPAPWKPGDPVRWVDPLAPLKGLARAGVMVALVWVAWQLLEGGD